MKEFDYDLDYKSLDFTDEETANFIVLEGESKEFYWFALIQTTFESHWRFRTADI